jgi:N-acyl-D-amino-acid deacylase
MTRDIDLVIRSGTIYEGTGNEPFVGDVAISRDRIAFITRNGERFNGTAAKVIEAGDLSVCPGFIDTHAHSEFTLLADGRAEGKVLQGITTEINGNCGLSAAPLYGEAFEHREDDLRELGIKERWETFREYLGLLGKRGHAVNFATLAGHGNIRASVLGFDDREPDETERGRMEQLLLEAVREGALGLSTGLIYPPGVYAATEEITGLARCIRHLIYTSHMRSESDGLEEAIAEAIGIGRESGIAVQISHLKTGGSRNWAKIDKAIALIEGARAEGLAVTADRYPYIAASTDLDSVLPAWAYAGGAEEELRRLRNAGTRGVLRGEILSRHPGDAYWNSITISSMESEANRWMEGKTISFLAERTGKAAVDFLMDILIEERLRIGAIFHSMNEDNLRRFLALPYLMMGTDSSARSTEGPTHKGKPHPRGFGTFPRFVGRYARDLKLMATEEAVRKVTLLPALTFGLAERGLLKEGYYADIVVFDEKCIIDRATFEEPFLKSEGIHSVLVNGSSVVYEGNATGEKPGRIVRHAA